MSEFDTPPEELLPPYNASRAAIIELDRILIKARRLLTVAAVYLAAEREDPNGKQKPIPVERGHMIEAAEIVFVPEGERRIPWFNELIDSLLFDACFLSHSTKDKRFCDRLHRDLKVQGVGCWYFPVDATWGKSVWELIDREISRCDRLLVVCSKHSLASSPVLREIERALQREDAEFRQHGRAKQILFPITIDDYLFHTWDNPRKADVLAKVVGDFRGWNRGRAKYDAALRKLLQSLESNESAGR